MLLPTINAVHTHITTGDWECPECGANVFGSKISCYRCQCPRPGGPGPNARDWSARDSDDRSPTGGRYDSSRDRPLGRSDDRFQSSRSDSESRNTPSFESRNSKNTESRNTPSNQRFQSRDAPYEDRSQSAYGAGRDDRGGGAQRRDRFPPFLRKDGDAVPVDEVEIVGLIGQREEARRGRDYTTADNLRDVLQRQFGVAVSLGPVPCGALVVVACLVASLACKMMHPSSRICMHSMYLLAR